MASAQDIQGTVFRHGSAVFFARVVNNEAQAINQTSIQSASYTIFALAPHEPNSLSAVAGHEDVALTIADVVFDTLQDDDAWTVDSVGYNFRHELDVSSDEAFSEAGRMYQVRYELLPVTGQKIIFRFQVRCI